VDARDAAVIVGTSIGAVTAHYCRRCLACDMHARVTGEPFEPTAVLCSLCDVGHDDVDLAARSKLPPAGPRPRSCSGTCTPAMAHAAGLLLAAVTPSGEVSTVPVADAVNRMLDGDWPSKTLWVCAVDLDSGERVVLGQEDARPRPWVQQSRRSNGRRLRCSNPSQSTGTDCDGGLHSPANADVIAMRSMS